MITTSRLVPLLASLALAGCSSAPTEPGPAGIADDMKAAVVGFHRGVRAAVKTVVLAPHRLRLDAQAAHREADAIHAETGLRPSVIEQPPSTATANATEPAPVPVLRSLEMDVREDEMLADDGSLHPSAARALARMDGMVVEHGGDFAVYVPAHQHRSVDEIRNAAPHAAIIESSNAETYRLVVTPERG
jgi:hypothetical protein